MTEISGSDQTNQYFLQEASELLQTMDDELQDLREAFSVQKVHNLMRAAHTLKGASASVGLEAVKKTTHSLEDVFKALCYQDTVISVEMEALVFQGYDCLKLLMSAQLASAQIDEADILDRMAVIITRLQEMLGDRFGQAGHLPTSSELGFDMTQSIFEVGVAQRIEELEEAIEDEDPEELLEILETQGDVFIGLAESLDLPGFGEIATKTLDAIDNNPDRVIDIASVALADYKAAQALVLAGDRERGGEPSVALQKLCHPVEDLQQPQLLSTLSTDSKAAAKPQRSQTAERWKNPENHIPARIDHPTPLTSDSKMNVFQQVWAFLTCTIRQATTRHKQTANTAAAKPQRNAQSRVGSVDFSPEVSSSQAGAFIEETNASMILENTEVSPLDVDLIALNPIASLDKNSQLSTLTADLPKLESSETHESSAAATTPLQTLAVMADAVETSDLERVQSQESELTFSAKSSNSFASASVPPKIMPAVRDNANASIRMSVSNLDQLSQSMGELLTYHNRLALYNEQLTTLTKKLLIRLYQQRNQLNQPILSQLTLNPIIPQTQTSFSSNSSSTAASDSFLSKDSLAYFDSLELDQYSDIQLLIQSFIEETVQQSESAEAIELFVTRSTQALEKQKQLISSTRKTLLNVRMLPLETILKRFPPALERLQAQHDKRINLTMLGSAVLVDKVILDKLYDPLLHLVRNAFDHGIESPIDRQRHNKPAEGNITIEARQQGCHLVIDVKDDGQGLNLESIRQKAIETHLITVDEGARLTPEQTIDLLFEAGFSTASEIDDLSGRGVGLDAVQAQVRSLQGCINVSYQLGSGTCFSLQIPSSLTISKLLLCQSQGRIYAIMTDAIEHMLIPNESQVRVWEGRKSLTWQSNQQDRLVPVHVLTDVLKYAMSACDDQLTGRQENVEHPVILLKYQDTLIGLEVDQLLGEQELVISTLGNTIIPPAYLYGSSTLPDGRLALVLDGTMVAKMIVEKNSVQNSRISSSTNQENNTKAQSNDLILQRQHSLEKLILTVDDSVTVRNTLVDALQKSNYKVIQARDGIEALQKLKQNPHVAVILCDIEMPRMNGFEFLKARQQAPEIAAIPTIMLTSREGEKYRRLTKALGATAYLTKPYLVPQLLEAVADAIENKAAENKAIQAHSITNI